MTSVRAVRTRLKPGMEESYDRLHSTVPDALAADLVRQGNSQWLIFRHGQDLFHVIFTEERNGGRAVGATGVSLADWHRSVAAHLEPVEKDAMSAPMALVWSLTENGGSPTSFDETD